MSLEKPHTIQIRVGPRTSGSIRKWLSNQENPTESNKRILEHFTRLYGYGDIDSDEVQIGMARDVLIAKGETMHVDNLMDTPQKREENKQVQVEKAEEITVVKVDNSSGNQLKKDGIQDRKLEEKPNENIVIEERNNEEEKEVIPVKITRNISDLT